MNATSALQPPLAHGGKWPGQPVKHSRPAAWPSSPSATVPPRGGLGDSGSTQAEHGEQRFR
eukprot:scaffold85267_cov36-Phaeocystis_antarctica.AAC.1